MRPDGGARYGTLSLSCSLTCRSAPAASVSTCSHSGRTAAGVVLNPSALCFLSERHRLRAPDGSREAGQALLLPPEALQRRPGDQRPREALTLRQTHTVVFSAGRPPLPPFSCSAHCSGSTGQSVFLKLSRMTSERRDLTQGGVKSTAAACVKDNLWRIVEGTHTRSFLGGSVWLVRTPLR